MQASCEQSREKNGRHEHEPSLSKSRVKDLKYQLWPTLYPGMDRERKTSLPHLDFAELEGCSPTTQAPRPSSPLGKFFSTSPRHKNKPSPSKTRKASVTDLGHEPMTTVQEVPQDSPTIPGRPPLHERSISAPGTAGLAIIPRAAKLAGRYANGRNTPWPVVNAAATKRKSLSPKNLSRLVIPAQEIEASAERRDETRRSEERPESDSGTPPAPPPKSPWMEERALASRTRPSTPKHENMSSLSLASNKSNETPITAPEDRSFTRPWGTPTRGQSPSSHVRQNSEPLVMERGRPTQRKAVREDAQDKSPDISIRTNASVDLPMGFRATEAASKYSASEITLLQQQAHDQATQFEVLSADDVMGMSRELRALDERCDYLRRTLSSLRVGRRGLHTRMVTYLRSPRMAKFSRESMLKQEEALGELDVSIDEWIAKLDQAENRRTRVRQKLLEHVAGALTIGASDAFDEYSGTVTPIPPIFSNTTTTLSAATDTSDLVSPASTTPRPRESTIHPALRRQPTPPEQSDSSTKPPAAPSSLSSVLPPYAPLTPLALALSPSLTNEDDGPTPPRSPDRPRTPPRRFDSHFSPSRYPTERSSTLDRKRNDVQSIKIYAEPEVYEHPSLFHYPSGGVEEEADTDVYALLADVEQEISAMAAQGGHAEGGEDVKRGRLPREQWIEGFAAKDDGMF